MIPKIIHYCWFGGTPLSEDARACIDSWRRHCPDYEIREWNESNFDVHENTYCREAYEAKKWAFVADYVRLWVVLHYGGIYMDTDVEVVRSMDSLLGHTVFMGFESDHAVSLGTFGAEKGNSLIREFLSAYDMRRFCQPDGGFDMTTNLRIVTPILVHQYGLRLDGKEQSLREGVVVYPTEVFIAKDYYTGWILCDESTFSIHHYAASWLDHEEKQRDSVRRQYLRNYLKKIQPILNRFAVIRMEYAFDGMGGVVKRILTYITKHI